MTDNYQEKRNLRNNVIHILKFRKESLLNFLQYTSLTVL
jgi:hypothetical protein